MFYLEENICLKMGKCGKSGIMISFTKWQWSHLIWSYSRKQVDCYLRYQLKSLKLYQSELPGWIIPDDIQVVNVK